MADVLTEMQREALRLFFDLPESSGFVLAGGAALIASGLSERPTQDIDLFSADATAGITVAADALEAAFKQLGWSAERIRDTPTFRRLVVRSATSELLVALAVDSPPLGVPTITAVGPTYLPEELAARKVLALFDRAAARDFVDLQNLAAHFVLNDLVTLAARLDGGFDPAVLAEMLSTLDRYADEEIADLGADPDKLRAFITAWREQLSLSDI